MAATLALSRANVHETGPAGERTYDNVAVTVRRNGAVLRRSVRAVAEGQAVRVEVVDQGKVWAVTLDDGRVWTVTKLRRKCCGG